MCTLFFCILRTPKGIWICTESRLGGGGWRGGEGNRTPVSIAPWPFSPTHWAIPDPRTGLAYLGLPKLLMPQRMLEFLFLNYVIIFSFFIILVFFAIVSVAASYSLPVDTFYTFSYNAHIFIIPRSTPPPPPTSPHLFLFSNGVLGGSWESIKDPGKRRCVCVWGGGGRREIHFVVVA